MRDFSWQYFTMTGDVDAYLLYKHAQAIEQDAVDAELDEEDEVNE
ncbi:YqzL family protein [Paenibacillus massiliensis]|nr:YqzL family protein [Paenibacillus massiliensis]